MHKTLKNIALVSVAAVLVATPSAGCASSAGALEPVQASVTQAGSPGSLDELGSVERHGSAARAAALAAKIRQDADAVGVDVGVVAQSLDSDEAVEVGADESFPMLSTFKVYAAASFLDQFGTGEALDETVPIDAADIVDNSPVTGEHVGQSMSYRDVIIAALTRSDNTAGNLLLAKIGGPAAVTDFARRAGDTASHLDRWEVELNEATPGDDRDSTTPRGLATGFRAVLDGDVLTPEARDLLVGWMGDTETSDKLSRASLPDGWTTADKSGGGFYGTRNSAGLLLGPNGERVLLVVLARDKQDRKDAPYANEFISGVAADAATLAG